MKKFLLLFLIVTVTTNSHAQKNDQAAARDLIMANRTAIGLTENDLKNVIIKDAYFNRLAGTQMVYIQQSYLNLPVFNQLQVLAFRNGQIVSNTGGRIRKMEALAGSLAEVGYPAESAVAAALAAKNISKFDQLDGRAIGTKLDFGKLGVCSETVTAELMWLPLRDGREVHLVWQIRVVPNNSADYWLIRVDARSNKVIDENNLTVYCNWDGKEENHNHESCTIQSETSATSDVENRIESEAPQSQNLVANASYLVIPYPAESPRHSGGTPDTVFNPWNLAGGDATSLGWHNDGINDYSRTRGNNVYAQEDRDNNNSTFGGMAISSTSPDPLQFIFAPDFTQGPTVSNNQQFSLTNLFYWNNLAHDVSYIHGFDEPSGNFQNNNQGRGGLGNDLVVADCQDAGGTNNANFATPDDGARPRMQMYLWSGTPQKDGSLDNGVVTHEYMHGISNRLTGGPSSSSCLSNAEQMGEGWSDYYTLMITQNWATSNLNTGFSTPRSIGTYAAGQAPNGGGIRTQKYCTNMSVNTKKYAASIPSAQHDRGELWCATLWDMTWNIINQTGIINPTIFDTTAGGGNMIALRLVIEGMRLQPCNPGFITGRDAILKADSILYGGQFSCAIREAFRRRGMGALASQGSSNSVTDQVPDFSGGVKLELTQGGVSSVAEGQEILYTIKVTSTCTPLNNYIIRDTLPANVTYVSGGNYDPAARLVTFTVNQAAGSVGFYQFRVRVNTGAYFAPTYPLIQNFDAGNSLPSGWSSTAAPSSAIWTVSNIGSYSPSNSAYCENITAAADQKMVSASFSLPAGRFPRLSFWHQFNTEDAWDGGVVEISTNNGTSWVDLGSLMVENGYNNTLGDAPTCVLANRSAFTGTISNFIRTTIDLSNYAGTTARLRFWFGSDDNTAAPAPPGGWFVDDVQVEVAPLVKMRAYLFSDANIRSGVSDTITNIVNAPLCINAAINNQPQNINACAGSNASISVTDQGTNNTYQWQVSTNGGGTYSNISGATAATLNLSNVTTALNSNLYRVIITNNCPSTITSTAASLSVSNPAAIVSQPASPTLCSGLNASLNVAASGDITGYQWQVSTNGGSSFSDMPGETTTALNLNAVTPSMNGNIYRLVLSSCNSATSTNALLTVQTAPQIISQPQSISVCNGNNHTFTVNASGTNLTYQWQISTDNGVTYGDIGSANGQSYTLSSVTPAIDNYRYRVILSGTCPSPVTSDAAIISVGAALNITDEPDDVLVCAGTPANLSVSTTGAITYQWQVSTNGGASFGNVNGANAATLSFNSTTASQQGNQYRVVITGCGPTDTSNIVTLSVNSPVSISSQPANTGICSGSDGSISVSATATGIAYQWQISTDNGSTFSDMPGETNAQINFSSATLALNGNSYRVIITPSTPCAVSISDTAILTINLPPTVTASANPSDVVCAGTPLILTGAGASTYSWNSGVSDGVSFIPSASGIYTVTGTDANTCTNTASISITVNALPDISITATPSNSSLLPGESVVLTATSNPPSTSFIWYKNNVVIPGATSGTLTVNHGEVGSYKASVTDAITSCSNTSNVISVKDSILTDVFIYPNPNNGLFTVRVPATATAGNYNITVWDSKGALVYQGRAIFTFRETKLNLSKLCAGVYVIRVTDFVDKIIRTGKVVIGSH